MQIAIIGGGASGLACAIESARKAKRQGVKADITIYEANEKVGKKILATGNGRCNLTNLNAGGDFYLGDTKLAKAVNEKFSALDNLDFFKSLGLYTRHDSEGRVYPLSNQATSVLDVLRFECERLGVNFVCDFRVNKLQKVVGGFDLGDSHFAHKVVFACGGKAGVKNFNAYDFLKKYGFSFTKVSPSLTKLTTDTTYTKPLKGVRANVKLALCIDDQTVAEEVGEILFADYGLSGIAIMQLSAFVTRHFQKSKTNPKITIDFVQNFSHEELTHELNEIYKRNRYILPENLLTGFIPKKIGLVILKSLNIAANRPMKTANVLSRIAQKCKEFEFEVTGVKDFSDAQVTSGGLNSKQININTLESIKHKNLFFCGELLDVDGLCGGFNLQFAWSSGRLCGQNVITNEKI
ncbi:MAG: aminoacetone oxidase family FAD-binding enzyme [Clostridia bacterium]